MTVVAITANRKTPAKKKGKAEEANTGKGLCAWSVLL
jgi:hypothetical protein